MSRTALGRCRCRACRRTWRGTLWENKRNSHFCSRLLTVMSDEIAPAATEEAAPETAPVASTTEEETAVASTMDLDTILPLSANWTLFFSDTSKTSKTSHDTYIDLQSPLFTSSTVQDLCGSLKAFKRLSRSKRAKAGEPDSMGLGYMRPGMNLYFFRSKAMPAWEDAWNEKGGRLTLSPPTHAFDNIFEQLVLLLGGSDLEAATSELLLKNGFTGEEGLIIGVVASRRARGDRIEIWLGGRAERTAPGGEWIEALKKTTENALDIDVGKYKKHF